MPVRFSCQHCGQRLSVKSEKVGSPVRCPKCNGKQIVPPPGEAGHEIASTPAVEAKAKATVPATAPPVESETVAKTPATKQPATSTASPRSNLSEAKAPPAEEFVPPDQSQRESSTQHAAVKATVPPPPPQESVSEPPPPPPLPTETERHSAEEPEPPVGPPAEPGLSQVTLEKPSDEAHQVDPFSEFAVYDEPAEWVYEEEPETPVAAADAAQHYVAVSRTVLYVQGGLLATLAIVGFGFGFIAGRLSVDEAQVSQVDRPATVTGLVLYHNAEGEEVPDEQAVVLIVPVDRQPEQKMQPGGLSPSDPLLPIDHPTFRQLKMLGGAMGRTDSNGRYNLRVPREGEYYLLFLSEHATPQNGPPRPEDVADLGNYVLNAFDLLSGKAYGWEQRKVSGNISVSWQFP